MARINAFCVEISQHCLSCWIIPNRTHKSRLNTLARKSHSRIGCTAASTKIDIVYIRLIAKFKPHELFVRTSIANGLEFLTVTKEHVLNGSTN
jgi:hypothetical protein